MFGSQAVNEITGIIQFDIRERVLRSILGNARLTDATTVLLMNDEGQVVSAEGSDATVPRAALWERERAGRGGDFGTEKWATVRLGTSGPYLVGTQGIENSNWVLFLLVPRRDIVSLSAQPTRQMLLVFFLIVPLSLLFAFGVSSSATKRIQNLIAEMGKAMNGDFTVELNPENRDEIGRLTESFNAMIREIGQLINEKYTLGKEVKNLELKALQAQINPHFLYNTLDLINWMSLKYAAEEIRVLVSALSRFYKLSLGGGEDTVTVRDEILHTATYVQIQNMRYENSIAFFSDVPDSVLDCSILKLVLQPLVENAIFHGIMPTPEARGTIRLAARIDNDILYLSIRDDGAGMPPEEARRILSRDHHNDPHGYGVHNIHERLRLNYGPDFGLEFARPPAGEPS